jgi:hypothetical protein
LCEVGWVESPVRMSSIRSLLVGELTLLLLSHVQSIPTQPILHVLSSTTFNMLRTVNEGSLELAVSLRSVLHTSLHLHPRHYLSIKLLNIIQLRIKASFHWIRQELE